MAEAQAKVLAALKAQGIEVTVTQHAAVMTSEAHFEVAGQLKGQLAKNLFIKDKKKNHFLVVIKHDRRVDIKKLGALIGAKGAIRFCDEAALQSLLGVAKGCVTPLAVINDSENKVKVVLDKSLDSEELPVLVHPLSNEATVDVKSADLCAFVAASGNECEVVDLDAEVKVEDKQKNKGGGKGKQKKKAQKKAVGKGETKLGLEYRKDEAFAGWYQQVVTRSEMIEYYDISGCYILRPWSYQMWEGIQQFIDGYIKNMGVKNSYFPLFVSKSRLQAEEDHIDGFAPEVAWVTRSGSSELEEHIAVRPTSETIMYPAFSKWIRSHRDLPLKLNQWSNVVRWEFKSPTPFIRSREFLWQEGHSAFATKEEALEEVVQILDMYAQVYQDLLAVPVVQGKKTEMEKFAGGLNTTTVEAFIPATGRGIQGATSHCLGDNFGKIFDIRFEDKQGKKRIPIQNSWGMTTRTIGVMVMVHGDDKGLVLPPRIAPVQIIIVPIVFKKMKCTEAELFAQTIKLAEDLKKLGIRAEADVRDCYNPGWKYNHWEQKGVPVRLELGPRDVDKEQCVAVTRMDGSKRDVAWKDFGAVLPGMLADIQQAMLDKATAERDSHIKQVTVWNDFLKALDGKHMALAPWCGFMECEEDIKKRSGEAANVTADEESGAPDEGGEKLTGSAKSLCIPFEQPKEPAAGYKCVGCGAQAINWTLFGRSY